MIVPSYKIGAPAEKSKGKPSMMKGLFQEKKDQIEASKEAPNKNSDMGSDGGYFSNHDNDDLWDEEEKKGGSQDDEYGDFEH